MFLDYDFFENIDTKKIGAWRGFYRRVHMKWSTIVSDQSYKVNKIVNSIGHVNIGIIFSFIKNSPWCFYATESNADELIITQVKRGL